MRYRIIKHGSYWSLYDGDGWLLYDRKTVQEIIVLLPEDCK